MRQAPPFPDPLTVTAFFLRPARPGPAKLRTEVVCAGRRDADSLCLRALVDAAFPAVTEIGQTGSSKLELTARRCADGRRRDGSRVG